MSVTNTPIANSLYPIIDYATSNPSIILSGAVAIAAVCTGQILIGTVAIGAILLVSKIFKGMNTPQTAQLAMKIGELAKRDGFIRFYKKEENPTTAVFGNFHLNPINHNGRTYQCAEAAFQAQKFEGNPELMKRFERLDGDAAWKLARTLTTELWTEKNFERWEKGTAFSSPRRLIAMAQVLDSKFKDEKLATILKATGDAYLVEHIPVKGRDAFWGDDNDGSGENHLGKILMDVRKKLGGTGRVTAPENFSERVKILN